jgi:hypothetical protein
MLTDHFLLHDLNVALKQFDPDLEVLYDWATAGDALRPGHHIYRVKMHGGVPADDTLVLVMSIQQDDRQVWPQGKPLKPGMFVVDMYRKICLNNGSKERVQDMIDGIVKKNRQRKADAAEEERRFKGELRKYGIKGTNGVARRGAHKAKDKLNRTPKVTTY